MCFAQSGLIHSTRQYYDANYPVMLPAAISKSFHFLAVVYASAAANALYLKTDSDYPGGCKKLG